MEAYIEEQKFNQPWLKLAIIIPFVTVISGFFLGNPKGMQTTGLIISFSILGLITALFYYAKLVTKMDEKGITIRFYPFQRYYYFVGWHEIETAVIRKYKPIAEYGGWGIRYSQKNGKAYNVSGNNGLQLELKSGKKFLIGTQKVPAMQNSLDVLKNTYAISCIK